MRNAALMLHGISGVSVSQVTNGIDAPFPYYATRIVARDVHGNSIIIDLFSDNKFAPLTVAEVTPTTTTE